MLQKILAGKEAQRQDKAYASSAGVKLGQSGEVNRGDVMQTSEFRDVNGNGVEDREEGIYRKGENFDASQASIPKRSFEQYMKELKAVAGDNRDLFGTA